MRIHINTTPNKQLVPFNHQHKLVGVIHKWIGQNELHGHPALYSFSWLQNARANKEGLNYPTGANFFIGFYDDTYLKQVVKSIMHDVDMCYDMQVTDVAIEEGPDMTDKNLFQCASPIFIQRYEGDKTIHHTYEDPDAGKFLAETLWHKMELAGLPKDESLKIRFEPLASSQARIKVIDYRGIRNKVSICPVSIEAQPDTKLFAWNVGLGSSTGIGFGAIY
jgi:CRISPR-associated endoribonuclease Cas6